MSQTAAFAGPERTRVYAMWALQVLLAAAFLAASAFKLAGAAPTVEIFDQIGSGQWFLVVTALVEIIGAVGLLVSGLAGPAALGLGVEMCCAVVAHLAILHINPAPAVVLFVLSAALAVLCREQITALLTPRSGGLAESTPVDAASSGARPELRAPAVLTFINRQRSVRTMKLLHIDTSILGGGSVSRELTAMIVKRLTEGGNVVVTYRDLTAEDVPHLTIASLPSAHPAAKMAGELDAVAQAVRDESDRMLEEFLAADTVVIGAPMYNFTIPTQLKAWIDRIVIPGKTFRYGANGPEGLAGGKRVVVAIARGGFYGPETATVSAEHAESLLRTALGFMGIPDPQFVLAEGLAAGEANKTKALASARDAVGQLAA